MPLRTALNPYQQQCLTNYDDGAFEHLRELPPEELARELEHCGDGLLRFMMVELADSEGCDSPEEARRRLELAGRQLAGVAAAVEN